MAWNLINEPRCESPAGCGMQEWVAEMVSGGMGVEGGRGARARARARPPPPRRPPPPAPYLKRADPNHLVTLGADGFYSAASCLAEGGNPFLWAGFTGTDFLPNPAVDGVDYAAIHLGPDTWQRWDPAFGKAWLDGHIEGRGRERGEGWESSILLAPPPTHPSPIHLRRSCPGQAPAAGRIWQGRRRQGGRRGG